MKSIDIISAGEMAKAEREAIAHGVSAAQLMENAGCAIVQEIIRRYGPRRTVVLAGPGNNGGDGYVVARLLKEKGFDVAVAALVPAKELEGEAAAAAKKFKGEVVECNAEALVGAALVVDALFGTGLKRPLEEKTADLAEKLAASRIPVVAVDIPSGVDGSTGAVRGVAVRADVTVTFERKKAGHVLMPGKSFAGDVVVKPIGIPAAAWGTKSQAVENLPALWLAQFPWPKAEGHKYHRGYAAIVGGDAASTGAARLSAVSALRVGAGLVSVLCPPTATATYAANLTSVMVKPIKDLKNFETFLEEPHRDAVLVGPGSGVSARTRSMALAALKHHKKLVLDADALTVFEAMPERLFAAIKASGAPVVLTPHHAEFRRVFDTLSGGSKIDLAKKAAALSGATVLLKGNDTVIANPDGRAAVNTNAPATLATAGAGDVLAGLIVGLLAMGMDGFNAACAAAWMHGEAARRFGLGLIAEDLPNLIPAVLNMLADDTSHEIATPAADASC